MKMIKNIKKCSRILRSLSVVGLFVIISVANVFPMRMTPQQVRQSKLAVKKIVAQGNQQSKTAILNELNKAGWSAEKIKEFRQKRTSPIKSSMPKSPKVLELEEKYPKLKNVKHSRIEPGNLIYPVKTSQTMKQSPEGKAFNDMLIDHYAQEIYTALQAIPVTERAEWVEKFTYILHLGLNEFQKKGVERYKKGLLSVKDFADDGSEIGLYGTKNEALNKVKNETNDFATIKFNDLVRKMTPVEFFNSLLKGSTIITQPIVHKKVEQQQVSKEQQEKMDQKLVKAFGTDEQLKQIKLQREREKQYRSGKYFVYEQGTSKGVLVDQDFLEKNSEMVKTMVEDLGSRPQEIILPAEYSVDTIQLAFDILSNKADVDNVGLEQLVSVVNLFNFLDVPVNAMNEVLVKIKDYSNKTVESIVSNQALKQLNPDLQTVLLLEPTVNCLKDKIITKYASGRKKLLAGHPNGVSSVAFSPDGKRIVSGCYGTQNNCIVWDITDPNNVTHIVLAGHPDNVSSVAFSPDGKRIVSGCWGSQNNCIVWDITDPNNVTHIVLAGHLGSVWSVAFSPDGKRIVSGGGGAQNNCIVWDITDPNKVTHTVLAGHPDNVRSVAFSPDGKRIVSGCWSNQNNCIVWDITNPNNVTHIVLAGHPNDVSSVAFSPDGKRIVSGCWGSQNNCIVWDITDPNKVTHTVLAGHPDDVRSVAFSPDGKRIVSGCYGTQNNCIVWDITDPNKVTHTVLAGHQISVNSVAFSPDGKRIVSGSYGNQNNCIMWTLLTDQEGQLLSQIKKYTLDQLRLVYQLCLQSSKGQVITLKQGSEERAIFMTLPQDMQNLLTDLFLTEKIVTKGWFSGWW